MQIRRNKIVAGSNLSYINLQVGKGGLPPLIECLNAPLKSGGKPTIPTMSFVVLSESS